MPRFRFIIARLRRLLFRAPLLGKLAGANALVGAVAAALLLLMAPHGERQLLLALPLALSLLVNLLLLRLALRPLSELGETMRRVSAGDLFARVGKSPLADDDLAHIGVTVNTLLDGLIAEHARVRELAARVIETADDERSRIARGLNESTAQTLAAVSLRTHSALAHGASPEVAEELGVIRELTVDAMEELRTTSQVLYPSVLDDLGLEAALRWLARRLEADGEVEVNVETEGLAPDVPRSVARALYRVAEEATRNAVRHGRPSVIHMLIAAERGRVELTITDDGGGFDVDRVDGRASLGLAMMRERIAGLGGRLTIESAPDSTTRVTARVPLQQARAS
ncbi:MAG TPA: sensor histidine kinase [Gemmatimonadaceae bacterium]|nr:sensor histidine kinase [Gemmatimonadaceae bacterium]